MAVKNDKLVLALGLIAAIGVIYLFANHASAGAGITTSNPTSAPLPVVAPLTPNPQTFVLPGGGYIPQSASGGGCGCSMPGQNSTNNFLPATETAFTDLVARSGVDPTALNATILAAASQTDFFPQTSSLAQMILSGGPGATP